MTDLLGMKWLSWWTMDSKKWRWLSQGRRWMRLEPLRASFHPLIMERFALGI